MSGHRDAIERELAAMTEWEGASGRVWERAVEAAESGPGGPGATRSRNARPWHARRWVAPALAAAAVLVISVGLFAPTLSRERSGPPHESLRAPLMLGTEPERFEPAADKSLGRNAAGWYAEADADRADLRYKAIDSPVQGAEAERSVVRKATMEITTPDVRAGAIKAQQLLSEPRGEFVESSDIDDSDAEHPRADLVLRVEAARLEEVVSLLRDLGKVEAERIDGEDVTDQLVDIGARLENERRIEKELAELLDKRPDDKLEDILAVRRELGSARERIEQLAAQQENLSRLVRLARVAVMLRAAPEEPAPAKGVWTTFIESLALAWADGLRALLGTLAGLVRVLVGGAIWFGLAALAGAIAWRKWRADHPRRLAEHGA